MGRFFLYFNELIWPKKLMYLFYNYLTFIILNLTLWAT